LLAIYAKGPPHAINTSKINVIKYKIFREIVLEEQTIVQSPPLSKVTPHGSTHMYYTVDLIEHPNSEADSAKINCNYILVVSKNTFMSRKWLLD
jgi:hypothetical protein